MAVTSFSSSTARCGGSFLVRHEERDPYDSASYLDAQYHLIKHGAGG